MLICFYLGSILMVSNGEKAMPITSGATWTLTEIWRTPHLTTLDNRGNQRLFELDSSYEGLTVDMVLWTCDKQAKQYE